MDLFQLSVLQREGDDLDAKIRKAEKEIRALENTLKLMNGRNEQYRKSFNKITDSSEFVLVKANYWNAKIDNWKKNIQVLLMNSIQVPDIFKQNILAMRN